MPSGLNMALRVMMSPNPAFAQIRDSDGRYFVWSVGIFALVCVMYAMPYFLSEFPEGAALVVANFLLGGIVSTAVVYLAGRRLGGNGSWKVVFSTIFYAHIYIAPMSVAVTALVFLTAGLTPPGFLDGPGLANIGIREPLGESFHALLGFIGHLAALHAVIAAFFVWGVVLWVKAVKAVDGFGTAKAFGIVALGWSASVVVTMAV